MKYDVLTARVIKIAQYYGLEPQTDQLIEECNELALATSKYKRALRKGKIDIKCLENLVSEIADVEIMITQIKSLLNITDEHVNAQKLFKVTRQEKRIAKEIERRNEKQNNNCIPCIEYLPDK